MLMRQVKKRLKGLIASCCKSVGAEGRRLATGLCWKGISHRGRCGVVAALLCGAFVCCLLLVSPGCEFEWAGGLCHVGEAVAAEGCQS